MDGWMDGWIDGWVDRWMDWLVGWLMDGCMEKWMDRWIHEWMDGWMDGWINEWVGNEWNAPHLNTRNARLSRTTVWSRGALKKATSKITELINRPNTWTPSRFFGPREFICINELGSSITLWFDALRLYDSKDNWINALSKWATEIIRERKSREKPFVRLLCQWRISC